MANCFEAKIKIKKTDYKVNGDEVEFFETEAGDKLQEEIEKVLKCEAENHDDNINNLYEPMAGTLENDSYSLQGYIVLRWAVDVEEWQEVAKRYGVCIRIQGENEGMGFYQIVEINQDGDVLEEKSIDYVF